ncbi:hypothetical protein C8T65DRAFT_573437 [Cerioporus squamosus]|nr:hypothetical protein C8T65DRAFT_573437 [Cerioporus squamosus]
MSHSAFFYGTLLHPSILRRVIGHEGDQLQLCPAILLEHTRHKIKHADYPAVLPYSKGRELFASAGHAELPPEQRTVRGTFVQGLNDHDIHLLDLFEGDEYTRENVEVHPLGSLTPLSSTSVPKSSIPTSSEAATDAYVVPLNVPSLPPLDALPAPLPAETYIYAGPITDLSPELWSYEDFVRENAWKWVGRSALEDNYVEVDRRGDMDGKTLRTDIIDTAAVPGSEDVGPAVAAEITA